MTLTHPLTQYLGKLPAFCETVLREGPQSVRSFPRETEPWVFRIVLTCFLASFPSPSASPFIRSVPWDHVPDIFAFTQSVVSRSIFGNQNWDKHTISIYWMNELTEKWGSPNILKLYCQYWTVWPSTTLVIFSLMILLHTILWNALFFEHVTSFHDIAFVHIASLLFRMICLTITS